MFSKTYFLSSIKFIPIDRCLFYYKNKLCLKKRRIRNQVNFSGVL